MKYSRMSVKQVLPHLDGWIEAAGAVQSTPGITPLQWLADFKQTLCVRFFPYKIKGVHSIHHLPARQTTLSTHSNVYIPSCIGNSVDCVAMWTTMCWTSRLLLLFLCSYYCVCGGNETNKKAGTTQTFRLKRGKIPAILRGRPGSKNLKYIKTDYTFLER